MDKQIEQGLENKEAEKLGGAIERIINGSKVEESAGGWKISNTIAGLNENSFRIWSTDDKESFDFNWKMENDDIVLENTARIIDQDRFFGGTSDLLRDIFWAIADQKRKDVVVNFVDVTEKDLEHWLEKEYLYRNEGGGRLHTRITPDNI